MPETGRGGGRRKLMRSPPAPAGGGDFRPPLRLRGWGGSAYFVQDRSVGGWTRRKVVHEILIVSINIEGDAKNLCIRLSTKYDLKENPKKDSKRSISFKKKKANWDGRGIKRWASYSN